MSNETMYAKTPQDISDRLDIERRLGGLEELKRHVATKEDIANLRTFIKDSVLTSENRTLRAFLRNWTVGAGIAVPALTALIVFLLNLAFR